MNYALFGANPTKLAVVDKMPPGLAPVLDERFQCAAFDTVCEVGDGGAYNLIATANCESLAIVREDGFFNAKEAKE